MINIDPMFSGSYKNNDTVGTIDKIDICFSIETPELIVGAIYINSHKSAQDTIVGKIFIYKYTSPYFIEVNFDETYINYLFEDPVGASNDIGDYTLKMLTIDFPGSILNMSTSNDIGMVQLPSSTNK